jgi:hypothetical protein
MSKTKDYIIKLSRTGEVEIVLFLVMATEPVGGARLPFLKTFSQDEALQSAMDLEAEWGAGARVKIDEHSISPRMWEHKYKTAWPLDMAR